MKNARSWHGILLAAGRGMRFDPSGKSNKLMQMLPSGSTVAQSSASNLLAVLPNSLAIIPQQAESLANLLRLAGCSTSICPDAHNGMANSLVHALRHELAHTPEACAGWVFALADMPFVQPQSIAAIVRALDQGAGIAVPTYQGRRGNPVGFSRQYLPQLLLLSGDQGARDLLKTYPVTEVAVDDTGILRDIDVPQDLVLNSA